MPPRGRHEATEIEEDERLERRTWVVERVGWAVLGALILAGLAGLFGDGPLSRTTVADAGGIARAEYERLARLESPLRVTFRWFTRASRLDLELPVEYLEGMAVERVLPPPIEVTGSSASIVYAFKLDGSESGEGGAVTFHLRPLEAGALRGEATLSLRRDGAEAPRRARLRLSHFIFP